MKKHLFTALLGLTATASAFAAPAEIIAPQSFSRDVPTAVAPVKQHKSVLRDSIATVTEGSFTYKLFNDDTATLTKYNGSDTEVTVPESVSNQGTIFKVTEIGNSAFYCCSGIIDITLPNSVTLIGDGAFAVCEGLKNITLPNSITSIGDRGFQNCSGLKDITLPNSLTSIGDGAFALCRGLKNITLPNSITSIGDDTFFFCSALTNITLPNSITSIGNRAFTWCSGLTNIKIPKYITSIGDHAFAYCSGLKDDITLPNSITEIGDYAFSCCSRLKRLTVEEGNTHFTTIDGVLFNAKLDTLIAYPNAKEGSTYWVPWRVTFIRNGAFAGCSGLTNIKLPPYSITKIGDYAFAYCSGLKDITLPNSITSIGDRVFQYCSGLKDITLPNSITSIGDGAFEYCSGLTNITLPNSITSIGDGAFEYCSSLKSFTVEQGNPYFNTIDGVLFDAQGDTLISFPNAKASSYQVPQGVSSIGDYAFSTCSGLKDITLPNSITSIGDRAFEYCSKLKSVYFESKKPSDMYPGDGIFNYTNSELTLYVPASAMDSYRQLFPDQTVAADPNISVTITDAKYATFYSGKTYTMPIGLAGAIVTDAKAVGTLDLSWDYNAGDAVPAGTALLLKGDEGLYDMSDFTTTSSAVPANNLLRGSIQDSTTVSADGSQDALFYKLSYDNEGTKVGFYWSNADGAAFTNPAHRCYLALPKAQYAHVKGFSLEGDDMVTAITDVNADGSAKAQKIYTLDGRRINAASTQGLPAGLYIVDGVKTIVK